MKKIFSIVFILCGIASQEVMPIEISLNGEAAERSLEMSGLAWYGDYLILMPQYVNKDAPCLLYTSPSPRDVEESRMPSSA